MFCVAFVLVDAVLVAEYVYENPADVPRDRDASDSSSSSSESMAGGDSDFSNDSEATRCFNLSDIDHSDSDATILLCSDRDIEPLE